MKQKPTKQQVKNLHNQIDDLRHRYHVENDPSVTDAMYQGLMKELQNIEESYPSLRSDDSPTQRVAGKPAEKFKKIVHAVKQWSLMDAFGEDDIVKWEERILKILEKKLGKKPIDLTYTSELKIDGLHVVLTYKDGILQTAATRGDGKIGEDVTTNVKTIHSVPLKLKKNVSLVAEGEVWMGATNFKKMNKAREKAGEVPYANPRNFAAGTIRQLDPKVVAERKLHVTAYDISDEHTMSQEEELLELKSLGFKTDNHWKVCKDVSDIMKFHAMWEKKKHAQEYWVDGIVVKVNNKAYQDLLGYTGKSPRWAIALKFPAEQGTTKITDIYVQVGRTGALTPVALMDPVQLAGTTVTHATLHNFDEIKRLDVRVGDTVVVEKAGDIIPKVVRVLTKMRTGKEKKVKQISTCPICHSPVRRKEILDKKKERSAALFCTNPKCFAQEMQKIIHFVSKKAFNIDGLGKKVIEQLMNEGLIKNAADIFTLQKGDIEPLERFAEKSAENLIASIQQAKNIHLARFIFALGIRHVGEESAIALAKEFQTIKKFSQASQQKLEQVPDVGPRVATSIRNYFENKEHVALVENLLDAGVTIKKESKAASNKFNGKNFVFTGTLQTLSRDDAKNLVRKQGGEISSSISKNTDFIVVGEKPGSKYEKAKKIGVQILTESTFLALIKK